MHRLKEVICFGEGAGANILARFAVRTLSLLVFFQHTFVRDNV